MFPLFQIYWVHFYRVYEHGNYLLKTIYQVYGIYDIFIYFILKGRGSFEAFILVKIARKKPR